MSVEWASAPSLRCAADRTGPPPRLGTPNPPHGDRRRAYRGHGCPKSRPDATRSRRSPPTRPAPLCRHCSMRRCLSTCRAGRVGHLDVAAATARHPFHVFASGTPRHGVAEAKCCRTNARTRTAPPGHAT